MKLKNTTDFPDWFLRRMISWVRLNSHIELPTKYLREVEVRNRRTAYRKRSGHASIYEGRIVLSIGTLDVFRPYLFDESNMHLRDEDGHFVYGDPDPALRIRKLVGLTAHELGHLAQFHRSGRHATYSESGANWMEDQVVEDFVANSLALTTAWMEPPAYAKKEKVKKLPKRLVRAKNALMKRDEWKTKSERAAKKAKDWQLKVNYYQRNGAYDELGISEEKVLPVKKAAKKRRRRRRKVQP